MEEFESRSQAMRRELEIKNKKSRKYIEWLINSVRYSVTMAIGSIKLSPVLYMQNAIY